MRGVWRLKNHLGWAADLLDLLKAPVVFSAPCPICGKKATRVISFGPYHYYRDNLVSSCPQVQGHQKHVCLSCGHYFTPWLDESLQSVATIYEMTEKTPPEEQSENPRSQFQLSLLRYVVAHLGSKPGLSLLDFGCGANRTPTHVMRKLGYDAHCCDILDGFPFDNDVFFRYEINDARWFGRFDAITSIDVIEHLGNTLSAWRNLNRLLKPNGIMAHCFPTRMHYGLRHWYCANPVHVCFFSRRSLRLLTRMTGFRLEVVEKFDADVPYVFRFRKVHEIGTPSS